LLLLFFSISLFGQSPSEIYEDLKSKITNAKNNEDLNLVDGAEDLIPRLSQKNWNSLLDLGMEKSESLGLDLAIAKFRFYKSIEYTKQGQYVKAIRMVKKAIPTFEEYESFYLSRCYNTMGNMFSIMGQKKKGVLFLRNSLSSNAQYATGQVKTLNHINNCLVLGNIYFNMNEYDSAGLYWELAKEESKTPGTYFLEKGFLAINLAKLSLVKNENLKALQLLENFESEAIQNKLDYILGYLYLRKGIALVQLSKETDAHASFNKGLVIAKKNAFSPIELLILKEMAIANKVFGKYSLAVEQMEEYLHRKEESDAENQHTQFLQIMNDYDLADKNEEINKLEKDKQKRNYTILLGSIGLLLILGFSGLFISRLTRQKLMGKVKSEKLNKELQESTLKSFRSQMNPHFMFNALNSIQEYIILNRTELASSYLAKFAGLMRMYLDYSREELISFSKELETLKLYLELEKLRFEDTLELVVEVDGNIDQEGIMIPTFLLQPYVENAFKHGLLHRKKDRKLFIGFSLQDGNILQCTVRDNGVGFKNSKIINDRKNKEHKSFSSSAMKKRLDLINSRSDKNISVEIIDLPEAGRGEGTEVLIKIPLI